MTVLVAQPAPEAGRSSKAWRAALPVRVPILFGGLLVLLQVWLIVHHASWRDEVQAFLLVRDSGSVAGLLHNLRYEGHPGLWYALVAACAAIVPTLKALALAQVLVTLTTSALVWRYAPFAHWTRFGVLASYFLVFEYGVMERSYGLGALLFIAFLASRRSLWAWVCLALMANVAVHCLLLSCVCVLILVTIERRWSWPGALLWGGACLFAIWTVRPAPDAVPVITLPPDLLSRVQIWLYQSSTALLSTPPGVIGWETRAPIPIAMAAGLALPVVGWISLKSQPWAAGLFILFYLVLAGLASCLYVGYTRHVGFLFLLAVGLAWIGCERGYALSIGMRSWIAVQAICGLWMVCCALVIPFSGSDQMAEWIVSKHLQTAAFAAYPGMHGMDYSARSGRRSYNIQKQCLDSFQRWNYAAVGDLPQDQLRARLLSGAAKAGGDLYVISNKWAQMSKVPEATRLATFPRGLIKVPLTMYRVHLPAATAPKAMPICP